MPDRSHQRTSWPIAASLQMSQHSDSIIPQFVTHIHPPTLPTPSEKHEPLPAMWSTRLIKYTRLACSFQWPLTEQAHGTTG